MRVRMTLYVDAKQQARIANLAARRKLSQSAVLEAAVEAFLAPEGTERFEAAAFALHLQRLERDLHRLERYANVTAETVALFVRFWLTVTPSLPPDAQAAARAKGQARYRAFVEALVRRLERGQSLLDDIREDLERQDLERQAKAASGADEGTGTQTPE